MKLSIKSLVTRSLTLTLLLFGCIKAMACSCAPQPDDINKAVTDAYQRADAVVLAEAIEVTELTGSDLYGDSLMADMSGEVVKERTLFSEIKSWKGIHGRQFYTEITVACCMCGISFTKGQQYLLYLYRNEDGTFAASSCGRSKPVVVAGANTVAENTGEENLAEQELAILDKLIFE
ncbi:MAG: hypothetical protein HWE27_18535 [Gammaproteobacteria bacterium]|nr:hypothetical protein [Gammaproteobacteria bacterium]